MKEYIKAITLHTRARVELATGFAEVAPAELILGSHTEHVNMMLWKVNGPVWQRFIVHALPRIIG